MDHDYQEVTEARPRRWPVLVGLMSAFAGGALSATVLQHKRVDPMLLGATAPTSKAPNVTVVDEFIEKSWVPGSISTGLKAQIEALKGGNNESLRSLPADLKAQVCMKNYHQCNSTCCDINSDCTCDQICNHKDPGFEGSLGCSYNPQKAQVTLPRGTCASCVTGSHLNNNECKLNVCQCPHGTAATGSSCPHDGDKHCTSCAANYRMVRAVCKRVVCHCLDGRGARGAACPRHSAYKCSSCNADYHLVGIKCDLDNYLAMLAIGTNESTH